MLYIPCTSCKKGSQSQMQLKRIPRCLELGSLEPANRGQNIYRLLIAASGRKERSAELKRKMTPDSALAHARLEQTRCLLGKSHSEKEELGQAAA
jgi:hypothetical protein